MPTEILIEQDTSDFVPLLTQEKMSEHTGLTISQIRYKVKKRSLPTYKIGRKRLVNIAKIKAQETSKQLITTQTLMTKKRFAKLVGVTQGQVQGWINKFYLPTKKHDGNRLIDITELCSICAVTDSNATRGALLN